MESDRFYDDEKMALLQDFTSEELVHELKNRYDNYIYYFLNSPRRNDSEDYAHVLYDFGGYCTQTQYGMFREIEEEFKYNQVPYEYEECGDEYEEE